jgi:hypothetical protein
LFAAIINLIFEEAKCKADDWGFKQNRGCKVLDL